MNWKDEFLYFLETNGVVDKFISYVDDSVTGYCLYLHNYPPKAYLRYAFDWQDTYEGYSFWEEVNDDWVDYYNYWNKIDDSDDVWVRTDMPVCSTT